MTTEPKRLYVDQTHLRGHVTGIERVALELVSAQTLAPNEVRPISRRGLPAMVAWQHLGLPALGLFDRSALFLFPGFPPGPLAVALGERCIVYVHDTFLIDRPKDLSWKSRLYMAPSFRFAVAFGRRFLVNSRATGRALRKVCRDDALVALLRPPVRDVFRLGDLPGPARYRPGETLRLLAIGTIEPRKDYGAAIAVTAALAAAGIPAELHVVGRIGWGEHPFLAAPPPFLHLHGYVDDAGLKALVGTCHLLLSTSRAEGLGLPLLEVQHGGIPVAAPMGDVFSEVLGESGLFVTPDDPVGAARTLLDGLRSGRIDEMAAQSRDNVARWNALAAADADRFRAFLADGAAAYARDPDGIVAPG